MNLEDIKMELSLEELSYIVWMYSNCDEIIRDAVEKIGDEEEIRSFKELEKVMKKICKECFGMEE